MQESIMDDAFFIPTPDQVPEATLRQQIPQEHSLHASVEAAISQNEDLMARLKVNLRRLTQTENENLELKKNLSNLNRRLNAIEDEKAVWKEHENNLCNQIKAFEIRTLAQRSLQKDLLATQEKLARYKKYQEKIRTQVKPFVQNLKNYSDSLVREVQELHAELTQREGQVAELEEKTFNLEQRLLNINEIHAHEVNLITETSERTISDLKSANETLRLENKRLVSRSEQFDEMRLKEDELENQIISMKRDFDKSMGELKAREQGLLQELGLSKMRILDNQNSVDSVQQKWEFEKNENSRLLSQINSLQEQLSSIRYMWTTQSEELEKAKQSQAALEKLNSDLSHKLCELTR